MKRVKQTILGKGVLSLLITGGILAVLVFASSPPAQAVTITVNQPPSGTLGSPYTFTVQIDVENTDLLPIRSVDLQIYNAASPSTYRVNCTNLPIPGAPNSTASRIYTGAGGTVSISGTTGSGWGYGYGYRYGYGYGYQSGTWGTYPFGYGYGYGYGYNGYVGPTSITYTVTWTPPTNWPAGTYNIKVLVYGNGIDTAFTHPDTVSFELNPPTAPPSGAGGGGGGGGAICGLISLAGYTSMEGKLIEDITGMSCDEMVTVFLPKGTMAKNRLGSRLTSIRIEEEEEPPAPPTDSECIGLVYNIEPDGATFDPAITLTFSYDTSELPQGVSEKNLFLANWDKSAEAWVKLESTVDPENDTVSTKVSHFSVYALMAYTHPASFTVADLSVTPAEVNIGESVSISVLVNNTGDLAGSYDVTLKINNIVVETKQVTLAGHASQKVTFTTTRDAAGSYTTSVDSLSGTFTVKAAPAPPAPAPPAPAPPAPPAPAPAPPAPVAPAPTPTPAPEVPPTNWGLIGGLIAGAIVIIGLLVYFLWWRRRLA